ncbi:hypothetical protein [Streptomyces sp. NPDC059906]|uniref:hypothetical protein n=1 Tax=Streptomyces sp. NPDC059906 TaxID=3346997 RepID=UPI0036656E7E
MNRSRVEEAVGNWTEQASAPREPKKARRWELRPTDVRKEVRLWWSAASHPRDASVTGTARDS